MLTTIMVSGSESPCMRQLKRAPLPGWNWTKRPSKQPSGQHKRSSPPSRQSMVASRHSQRFGSLKNASKTAAASAFTLDWNTRGGRVFSVFTSVSMGLVFPTYPLRPVAPDLFLPDRHDLLQAIDRILGRVERLAAVRRRDRDRYRRLS